MISVKKLDGEFVAMTFTVSETLHERPGTALYRAVRDVDHKQVILKTVTSRSSRPRDLERLRHELEIGRMLDAGAVRYLGLETHDGMPALVMEDFGGEPLDHVIASRAPIAIEHLLPLVVRIAQAVAEVHARGIVHRDLKPENILVAPATGEVRIAAFGIASRLPREEAAPRSPKLIEGSLPYISPEQTGRMNRPIDNRSDLYSLGVTFYELLTGRLPFDAQDALGWVHCHIARAPPPPVEVSPAIPAVLSAIVLKLLAKVPEERYQSATGLVHDLERCLAMWQARGELVSFPLGEQDRSERLRVPHTLYGREAELTRLLATFERVAEEGSPAMTLVSGYPGVGKSSLVYELQKPIVARRGFFVSGKFEQLKRDIPYVPIIQACRALVQEILAESDKQIATWRRRLVESLGTNAQVMVDMIPEVGLVIGTPPPAVALPPVEAQSRLFVTFGRFLGVFARPEHPLTIFLDDLQWVDAASLRLLQHLVGQTDRQHLWLIGAYRNNEVSPSHPLVRMIEEARNAGAVVDDVMLAPLAAADIGQLVADSVHADAHEVEELAKLVHAKTGGNPFFALQFLAALERKGLLAFDRIAARWRWDVARIAAEGFTDNIADLMAKNLALLPRDTQDMLRVLACLGNVVDPDVLSVVAERSQQAIEAALNPALERELLTLFEGKYRFPHDRVHEAAYELVAKADRNALHLSIGRILASRTPPEALDDRLFEIVRHFELGASEITSDEERDRVATLDLRAGLRARAATAFTSALRYFAAGATLLGSGGWERQHDVAFPLHVHWAESALLTGHPDDAEALLEAATAHAKSSVEKAAAVRVQIGLYELKQRPDRAIEIAIEFFASLGITLSPHPTHEQVQQELDRFWQSLGDRPIEALLELPTITDPTWRAAIDVLVALFPSAYFFDANLHRVMACLAANLGLKHGNYSASSYATLAALLGPVFGDHARGYRLGCVSVELVEKREFAHERPRVLRHFGSTIHPWNRPMRSALDILNRAIDAATEVGDVLSEAYVRCFIASFKLDLGEPLVDLYVAGQRDIAFATKHKIGMIVDVFASVMQNLRGLTDESARFIDPAFDAQRFEERMRRSVPMVSCLHNIYKLEAHYLAGEYEQAVEAARQAKQVLWARAMYLEPTNYHFYAALSTAAVFEHLDDAARVDARATLAEHEQVYRTWSETCPTNFEHRYALICAEIARIDGESDRAAELFERAIRSARENGFVQNEAIAYELASRFCRGRGLAVVADLYLHEARACYVRWGADGKVKQIDRQHPRLAAAGAATPSATIAVGTAELDFLSLVKASQTVSSEIDQDQLLRTLLQVVMELGGARRAALVLQHDDSLTIDAEAAVDESGITTRLGSRPIVLESPVPVSILQYVWRTRERVLLDDAVANPGRFASDPHLLRKPPRSLVCVPIVRQGEAKALLYLENDLAPGAFTRERLVALELLAAQAAISLQNARLLERERAGRARAELLADATHLLSSVFEYPRVLDELTRLCVRTLADWAIIDIEQDGQLKRLAGVHRNPAKQSLLYKLATYPAGLGRAPSADVLRSGIARVIPVVDEETIRKHTIDDQHADLIRRLGAGSALSVPLLARGALVGALTLVSETPGHYTGADLELAQELARRAALVIDNARLLQAESEALGQLVRIARAVKDMANTPLQTLELELWMLASTATPENVLRMRRAVERLKKLSHAMSAYTRSVEAVDEGFDAAEVLARSEPDR